MSQNIPIGSKNHFYSPVKELLNLSNRIHKKYSNLQNNNNNNNLAQLIAYIPLIEGNKIENFVSDVNSANFRSKLQKLGYGSIDFLLLEKQFSIIQTHPDIKNILIYYFCIYWYTDSSAQYDFSTILSLLNITRENMAFTDLIVHDFCFELILDKSMSISKSNTESTIFIPLFLTYIMTLKSLPDTSFDLLLTLFQIASSTDNENDINLLHETIEYIFMNNFDFLKGNDYSRLIDVLKINFNNLNSRSLKILGHVTNRGNASMRIMDIIHILYKQLYEFILINCKETEQQSPFQFINEYKSKLVRFEKKTKIPKKTFNFKFDVAEKNLRFIQFPFSILSFKGKKIKILNDSVYSKVKKISEFLSYASNDVILDFIAQFSAFLSNEKFFFEICDSFIEILFASSADQKSIGTIVELLSQSNLFLPSMTIFDFLHQNDTNLYLDERINYLRDRVFELISITDPFQISPLINSSQYYPFLFTEHLMRILLKLSKFSPQLFQKETIRMIIINSGIELGQLDSKFDMIKCAYITFISKVLSNQNSCDSFLSFSFFVSNFLSYVYQPEVQPLILNTLQKSISALNVQECGKCIVYIVDFFDKMVISGIDEISTSDFGRYKNLIEKAFTSLTIGLQYNISIAHYFISLFNTLLNFIERSPSISLILDCLKLFQIFSFSEKNWKLSSRHFLILHSSIDQLYGENPDDKIITLLFCCLGNSSFLESKESIVIVYPSILTLLFLIHSKSRHKNVELLKTFYSLCKYSDNNALAFHDAFIDLILIRYLCLEKDLGTISFMCHEFEFNIDRNEAIPIILDFLWLISPSRPNFSISSSMVDLLTITKDERILNFIVSMLYSGESFFSKMTKIPLDTSEPVLCVDGFDWSTLKNVFVIDFYLTMDEMISKRYRCCFSLFKITDDVNTLQLKISNGSLQVVYKNSSAFLFKNIFHQKQSHFSITFIVAKEKTKIFNFLNGERFSDASIDRVVFNRFVKMSIGGSDFHSKTLNHPCFGKIFAFQFFTCKLTEDEMILLNEEPTQFAKKPLFSTNFIKTELVRTYNIEYKDPVTGGVIKNSSKNRLIDLNRQFSSSSSSQTLPIQSQASGQQQGQNQQVQQELQENVQKISMDLLPSFHRSYHIIDFFCEISLYPKYLRIERLDVLLDVLFCIFTKHNELQKFFKPYFNTLFNHVLQKVELSTYLSLFRFMGILVNESMRLEWFEMFIINIVLWSKSNQFNEIVNHWNMSLIQYKSYFIDKNYLNDLLTQFMLRFQFDKDPESNNDEIMTVFCRFMTNIAILNFDQNSFDILISCILMCEEESSLYELVKILDSVSLTQAAKKSITKKKLQLLHKLFRYQNIELTICSIICLNNLSIVFPDYDCFAIAYILIGHKELEKIVDILIEKFPKYPNLMSLLVVLSLQAKKQSLLVDAIKQHFLFDSLNINMIFQRDFWYIWPILLMFNVSDDECKILCDFLSLGIFNIQIANSNDRIPIVDDIFIMIFRLSYLKPTFPYACCIIEYLIDLFEKKNCVFPQYISRYCLIFFFFKFPCIPHSDPLLQIYKDSEFFTNLNELKSDKFVNNNPLSGKMIFNIFELESLLGFDLFNFNFLCRININDSLELTDNKLKELYLKLDPPNSQFFDKRMLTFFTTPYDSNNKQNYDFEMSSNQLFLFDTFRNEIKTFFTTRLNVVRNGILKLFRESRINIANISQDEIRPFTHILLSKASNQLQRTTPKIEKEIHASLKKKDNKLTPMLYPFQLKNKANSKKNKSNDSNDGIYNLNNGSRYYSTIGKMFGKPLNKFQCIISKFDYKKNEKGYLYLYENMLCFSMVGKKKKFVRFDDIKYFLVRKVKDGFGYEIITNSLISILFFITHNDFNTLTIELKSYHFTNISVCSFSSDFFSLLSELSKSWLKRRTSNFEYLLKLNILSGHSFSQYHLYPVMPPIVSVFDDLNSNPDFHSLKPASINSPFDEFFNMNNRGNFTNSLTLMADYFFDFSMINRLNVDHDKIVLPIWASTKYEFIYLNRKKLEKIDIAPFIDRIFGVDYDGSDGSFLKLFKKQHDKRQPIKPNFSPLISEIGANLSAPNSPSQKLTVIKPTPLFIQEQFENQSKIENKIQIPIQIPSQNEKMSKSVKNINGYVYCFPQKIISSLIFLNQNSQLRFWIVFDNLKLCYVQLQDGVLRIKYEYEIEEIEKDDDDLSFFYSPTVIYIYSSRKSTVYFLNIYKTITQIPLYTEMPLFTVFDEQIIYPQRECSLYKMSSETLNFSRFCLTKSKLTAISSSNVFNIIVYATIDGIVYILSYSTGEEINQYNAGFEIKQILVTICMGFVVVLGDNQIVALTVNGEFIAKYNFGFLIRNIYSITICAGIDFVAFDNFDNEIGYFEIFYPQKYKIIKKCNSEVKRISYNPIDFVFVIVQSNGCIEILYHSIL